MPTLHKDAFDLLAKKKIPAKFKFVFFGDSWYDWGTSRADAVRRYNIFRACLNKAAAQKPLLILYGGDSVFTGSQDELSFFKETVEAFMKKTQIPFFMVPGNHEKASNGSFDNYRKIIGGNLNYAIDLPHINPKLRIIMLNNTHQQINPHTNKKQYVIDDVALARFKELIKINTKVLVVIHVPPGERGFPINLGNNKKFLDILSNNKKKVQGVLVSHIHSSRKFFLNNIPYYLSGEGGAGPNLFTPTINPSIDTFTSTNGIVSNFKKIPVTNIGNQQPKFIFLRRNSHTEKVFLS